MDMQVDAAQGHHFLVAQCIGALQVDCFNDDWSLYQALKPLGEDLPAAIELLTGAAAPILDQGPSGSRGSSCSRIPPTIP